MKSFITLAPGMRSLNSDSTYLQNILEHYFILLALMFLSLQLKPSLIKPGTFKYLSYAISDLYQLF